MRPPGRWSIDGRVPKAPGQLHDQIVERVLLATRASGREKLDRVNADRLRDPFNRAEGEVALATFQIAGVRAVVAEDIGEGFL